MYPLIFGILDSYSVMLVVGFVLALTVLFIYLRKQKLSRNEIIDILICGIVAIAFGIIFAILFQNAYDLIYYGENYKWTWGMTFYGGVFGGIAGFVLMYNLYYLRLHNSAIKHLLIVAPGCITLAHSVGRIGCFLDGCCYGKETNSWIGIVFPVLNDGIKRIPTQLIESAFLLILSIVLLILIFKNVTYQTFSIYMISYSTFRFIIEYFRGDYRGKIILGMSPSQIWCVLLFLLAPAVFILLKKVIFKETNKNEKTNS